MFLRRLSKPATLALVLLFPLSLLLVLAPSPAAFGASSHVQRRYVRPAVRWRTLFFSNFIGRAGTMLPANSWQYSVGRQDSDAVYVRSAAYAELDGHGNLVVTARHLKVGWRSGQVITKRSFMPKSGQSLRAQAKIEMPSAGNGYWPAFWAVDPRALVVSGTEPANGEIDVAETTDNRPWVAQLLHCGPSKFSGPCREPSKRISDFHHFRYPAGRVGYHLYTMVWTNLPRKQSLTFLVDNHVQLVITRMEIGARYWRMAFDHPYAFLFDIAIGGWGGQPNKRSSRWGAMHVAYFSVSVTQGAPKL